MSRIYTLTVPSRELRALMQILAAGDYPGQAIEDRPELQGVRVEADAHGTTLVASNGHQLAAIRSRCTWPENVWENHDPVAFVIPLELLAYLQRNPCEQVHLSYHAGSDVITASYDGQAVCTGTAPDESFNWRQMIQHAQQADGTDYCLNTTQFFAWQAILGTVGVQSPHLIACRMIRLNAESGHELPAALIAPCMDTDADRIIGIQVLNSKESETHLPNWI